MNGRLYFLIFIILWLFLHYILDIANFVSHIAGLNTELKTYSDFLFKGNYSNNITRVRLTRTLALDQTEPQSPDSFNIFPF